jgi:hypothetical protein
MRRKRLFCAICGARKSRVYLNPETKETLAICDPERGGCGAKINLYHDEYGKVHPVRVETDRQWHINQGDDSAW